MCPSSIPLLHNRQRHQRQCRPPRQRARADHGQRASSISRHSDVKHLPDRTPESANASVRTFSTSSSMKSPEPQTLNQLATPRRSRPGALDPAPRQGVRALVGCSARRGAAGRSRGWRAGRRGRGQSRSRPAEWLRGWRAGIRGSCRSRRRGSSGRGRRARRRSLQRGAIAARRAPYDRRTGGGRRPWSRSGGRAGMRSRRRRSRQSVEAARVEVVGHHALNDPPDGCPSRCAAARAADSPTGREETRSSACTCSVGRPGRRSARTFTRPSRPGRSTSQRRAPRSRSSRCW
jgi:hypothetical protein